MGSDLEQREKDWLGRIDAAGDLPALEAGASPRLASRAR